MLMTQTTQRAIIEIFRPTPAGMMLGESPIWDAQHQQLYWLDCAARQLWCRRFENGVASFVPLDRHVGAIGLAKDQAHPLIAARDRGFGPLLSDGRMPQTDVAWDQAQPEADRPDYRFNDGKVAPDGSFWAGSMHHAYRGTGGRFYRLTADRTVACKVDGLTVPNGPAWSPCGKLFYLSDSPHGLFVWDVTADGTLHRRRAFADTAALPGFADGSAMDIDGCLWSARWDGSAIARLTPAGKLDRLISLPAARITSCAFGGPDLDILYVTSARLGLSESALASTPHAGSLFALDVGVSGVPVRAFGEQVREKTVRQH